MTMKTTLMYHWPCRGYTSR